MAGSAVLLAWFATASANPAAAPGTPPSHAAATVYCALDEAPPQPCAMDDHVDAQLVHTMVFSIGNRTVRFSGTSQTGWWSGTLDGKAAMGYELNRGHTVFSTADLKTRFAWWYAGMQHGDY